MEIEGKKVLVLGAYGEVGIAVCRQFLCHLPMELVVASLSDHETRSVLQELSAETYSNCRFTPFSGNIFVRWHLKDLSPADIMSSSENLRTFVDDIFNELTKEMLEDSTLNKLIIQHRPEIIVDCINTATALSYRNIYQAYREMVDSNANMDRQTVIYRVLSSTSVPPLIRHVQILYESMKQVGTGLYLKIGTTGTGGMGLNIPFTHGEESPSRLLMAKAATAGAHTMLLYTLSKTPGGPIIKEIKPAAMIGWKNIGKGTIKRGNITYPLYDCPVEGAYQLVEGSTFSYDQSDMGSELPGRELEGVYIDTGENGVFSVDEFKTITSLGLMEFVTPEDIAHQAVMNIIGISSARDIITAIDSSVMEPTFRAGILRRDAIEEMAKLGNDGIAYGFLGPRMSKLVTECKMIKESCGTIEDTLAVSPQRLSHKLEKLLEIDAASRTSPISIGIPVLLPDGERLLFAKRVAKDKDWEKTPWVVKRENIDKWSLGGWVDLRPANMEKWQERLRKAKEKTYSYPEDSCSRHYRGILFWEKTGEGKTVIDVGEITAWVLINEFGGGRFHIYGETKELWNHKG